MGTNLLDELFSLKTDSETFVTSSLTLLEANVVLARNLNGNQLRPTSYNETVDRIGWDFRDHIVAIPLDNALIEEAQQLLPNYPLRAVDALYFATARRAIAIMGDQSYYVVSADRELNDTCSAYNLIVLNPIDKNSLQQLRGIRNMP